MSLAYTRTRWLGLAIPTAAIAEKIESLKPIMTATRPDPASKSFAPSAALRAALAAGSEKIAPAVITLRVVREHDTEEAPLDFKAMDVQPLTTTDANTKNISESDRPENAFASGFLITSDGTALTSYFNVGDIDMGARRRKALMRAFQTPPPTPDDDELKIAPPDPNAPKTEAKPAAPVPSSTNKVTKIYAYLSDGKRVEAHLVGAQKAYDLAVLKLDLPSGTKVPHVDIASTDLQVGSSIAILGRAEPPGNVTMNAGTICRSIACVKRAVRSVRF